MDKKPIRKKKRKKLKTLKFEVIPEHKDYKLPMGTVYLSGKRGLIKEAEFKPVTLNSNDTITLTFTPKIDYSPCKELPEEKNKIKIWLNKLRHKISKIFWDENEWE